MGSTLIPLEDVAAAALVQSLAGSLVVFGGWVCLSSEADPIPSVVSLVCLGSLAYSVLWLLSRVEQADRGP